MRPLRIGWIQSALALLTAGWLWFCYVTMRLQSENQAAAEAVWGSGKGVIVCFWHSRLSLAPRAWPLKRAQETRVLISLSTDGEFIAKAVERLGFPAIRGSSSKKQAPDKAKGGGTAFRASLRWLRQGGALALTPDGPRGPAEQMAGGVALLAKASGLPVLMMGLQCSPGLSLKTWDKTRVPLPFGRGAIVWSEALYWPEGGDLAEVSDAWAAELSALTRRAEVVLDSAS